MKVGTMLRSSVAASVLIAAASIAFGAATGRLESGIALAAGLLIGATNGRLVVATLGRANSFVLASVGRLILLTAVAFGVAVLLGPQAWLVLLGVGLAQLVMFASAVRQGLSQGMRA